MRVRIEGESTAARSVRSYLEKHGAAVTDGPADVYVLIEPSETGSVELDTIVCPLEASILKHLNDLVACPIVLQLAKMGKVTADNRIVIRIPDQVEREAEIAIFRGIAEHLGREAAIPATAVEPSKRPNAREWVKSKWSYVAIVLLAVACLIIGLIFAGKLHAETPDAPPMPISIEDREAVKDLQLRAQDAVIRQKDAETRRAEAQLDLEHSEHDRDGFNAQIRAKTEELLKKYAPDGKWEITPQFGWQLKKGTP